MTENDLKNLEAKGSFNLAHRISLQLFRGFPEFMDEFDDTKRACLSDGTGFTRARVSHKLWSHEPFIPTVMFRMVRDGDQFRVRRVPGVHDITGNLNGNSGGDPYLKFKDLLLQTFRARGGACNVFLLNSNDAFASFKEVRYDPPEARKEVSSSQIESIKGDRYRLLLWSGFTRNYNPSLAIGDRGANKLPYTYATVDHTPAALVERFIVINTQDFPDDVENRIKFYREDTKSIRPRNQVRILNSEYQQIAIL